MWSAIGSDRIGSLGSGPKLSDRTIQKRFNKRLSSSNWSGSKSKQKEKSPKIAITFEVDSSDFLLAINFDVLLLRSRLLLRFPPHLISFEIAVWLLLLHFRPQPLNTMAISTSSSFEDDVNRNLLWRLRRPQSPLKTTSSSEDDIDCNLLHHRSPLTTTARPRSPLTATFSSSLVLLLIQPTTNDFEAAVEGFCANDSRRNNFSAKGSRGFVFN